MEEKNLISNLENELNKAPIISGGNTNMSLSNILNSINKKEPTFELNPQFPTIRYIKEDEFMHDIYEYVEPNFTESTTKDNAKFILFSAPGATGKSALSKHICREYKGIYWELPNCKVAEFSFQGAIMEAVGNNKVSEFIESLKKGTNFLVIDAFDEAEAGSGRTGIEFFLRDLNNVTNECINICAILLARTESAIFIKNYCFQHNIPFKHYEVCYFSEENAKLYIKKGLERFRIPITDIVNECIDKQFKEITRILGDVDATAFLGYAPVLNALSASYAADRNTLNLLKNIHNSESSNHLLKEILDNLLKREREKFIQALKVKLPQITEELPNVYNETEQLLRIFEKIAYNGEIFLSTIDTSIPIEYHQEYLEVVDVQLPQHPFIKATEKNGCAIYNFTGTAFRDYVIAYGLSLEDANEFVRDYIDNIKYSPSQLLIGFYNIFSKGTIYGIDIPVIYNSFTAYAQFGDKINIYINGDKTDCSIEFMLERNNKKILILDFNITLLDTGISVNQLSNCYIDIEGKIYVGNSTNEARIYNSIINCDEIIWRSEHVSIEAYSPGE